MESYVAHRIVNPVLYLVQVDVFAAQAEALERLRFPLTANLLLEGDFRADNVLYQQLGAADTVVARGCLEQWADVPDPFQRLIRADEAHRCGDPGGAFGSFEPRALGYGGAWLGGRRGSPTRCGGEDHDYRPENDQRNVLVSDFHYRL